MKKTISVLIVIAMILGVFSVTHFGAQTLTYNGFTYEVLPDDTVEITGYLGSQSEITIPDAIDGHSVSSIKAYAFTNIYDIAEITVPDSVKKIGVNAFYGTKWYDNQKDGVVYAGKVLYKYKGKMPSNTNITIKDGTVSITEKAFENYSSLKAVSMPSSLKSIGAEAFYCCSSLTSVVIPDSVVEVCDGAFNGCQSLEKATLSQTLRFIGEYAFSGTALKELAIPKSVVNMGANAFSSCLNLKKADIKGKLKKIPNSAFSGCSALSSLTLPDTVEHIGKWAFQNCSALSDITFPQSVSYVGNVAFDGTKWLQNQKDGMVYINTVLYKYKGEMPKNMVIRIGEATTSISASAFYMCDNLKEITIPESISTIEDFTFYGCTSLEKVELSLSVKSIGTEAFRECGSLKDIVLPSSVAKIKGGAFTYCYNLSDITILNPYCEIELYNAEESKTIPTSVTINGYEGSTAEKFATDFGYAFVSLGEIPSVLGDVDGDNEVSIMDATAIQLRLANLDGFDGNENNGEASPDEATPDEATFDEVSPEEEKVDLVSKNGDVDYDGVVSIMDATKIQFFLAGLIFEL
ncbi:MAG: leucine-rich repeat domain-containing protein [Ruminococcus sp.]|nr:leucine-rich repeat domain-containing protein [Ruminococcus sp.]